MGRILWFLKLINNTKTTESVHYIPLISQNVYNSVNNIQDLGSFKINFLSGIIT